MLNQPPPPRRSLRWRDITWLPGSQARAELRAQYPDLEILPLKLRLRKYTVGDSVFCLGTTLLASQGGGRMLREIILAGTGEIFVFRK